MPVLKPPRRALSIYVFCNPPKHFILLLLVDGRILLLPPFDYIPYVIEYKKFISTSGCNYTMSSFKSSTRTLSTHPCLAILPRISILYILRRSIDFYFSPPALIQRTKTSAIHPRLSQPSHSFYSVNFSGQMHIFPNPVIQSPVWPCFSLLAKLLYNGKEFISTSFWLQLRCLDLNHQDERYPHT